MLLKSEEGCICDSLTCDGIEEVDMTDKERLKVIDAIFNWYKKNPNQLNFLLQDFIKEYGECEVGERCPQCGDTPCTYTLKI